MKKILFSHSYFYRYDAKQWQAAEPYPPLMTIMAAALMRTLGYEVKLFDVALKESPAEIMPILESFKPDYFVLFDDGFNYLTKMCLTTMRDAAFEMQKYANLEGATVITCSSDSTDHFEKYLKNGADFILRGEGEQTLVNLLQALESKIEVSQINGITYNDGANIITTPKQPILTNLDSLPQAAWDLIDVEAYRKIWLSKHSFFELNIATTRGCPYKCNWCAKPIYGNRYNSRSPEKVVDEIEFLSKQFGVHHFWMCDDIFGLKPNWVQEFRDELAKKKLTIRYKIQSRVDLLLKEDTIKALSDSGLSIAWVGAESGSQKILDAMDKGTDVAQIYKATNLLKEQKIEVALFLQFGYLGETRNDINQTLNMVLDLMPTRIGISVSYPLPGTKFYDKVKDDLKLKSNWVDSDDLDLMFTNTYQPAFYKKLHRYVHARFRFKRGLLSLKNALLNPLSTTKTHFRHVAVAVFYLPIICIDWVILQKLSYQKV